MLFASVIASRWTFSAAPTPGVRGSPGLAAAVVYIPAGADYFCFEPVPHIVNALNLPGHAPAMPLVLPGEVFTASITLAARPAISG